MRTLNFNDTVETVREIINSVGADFVYSDSEAYKELETCVYVYNGKPSCIVGRFLVESEGHDVSAFTEHEGSAARNLAEALGYDMSDPQTGNAFEWLLKLQRRQDTFNTTWGEAFDAAQELARECGLS